MTEHVAAGLANYVIAGLTGNLGADKDRLDFVAAFQAVLEFASAFHHEKPLLPTRLGFFLQQEKVLELGVLGRCDGLAAHLFLRSDRPDD